jgi:lambda family phage portal protein
MGKKKGKQNHSSLPVAQASTGGLFGGSRLSQQPAFQFWRPLTRDSDTDDSFELRDQRAFSRDLYRTSPIAGSGIDQLVAYRVATGLKCQPRILADWLNISQDQKEEWEEMRKNQFHMWASSTWASVEGDQNFYELQELIARSEVLSGDVFTILARKERPGWPFKLALQVIEADRVCNEDNRGNTAELFEGVQRATDGEIISIWVASQHPGSGHLRTATTWQEIPMYGSSGRRNILHRKRMVRPGQTRALPALTRILGPVKQLQRYTEAEIEAAVNSASMAIFATMSLDSFNDLFSGDDKEAFVQAAMAGRQEVSSWSTGKVLNTLPGETITSPTPGRPNPNFDGFVQPFFTLLGMGLNLPPEIVTGLFKSSYTAARAALQQHWQMIYIDRGHDVTHTCQPVYATWMDDGVADGWIQAPGYFADPFIRYAWQHADWTGSGPASLNPKQEAEAALARAQFLTSEADETIAYDGGDHATRHQQRVKESAARKRDGLPPLGGGAASAGTPAAPPQDDENDDDDSPDLPLDQ